MQKYLGTHPFNLWGHGDFIRLPGTTVQEGLLPTDRDQNYSISRRRNA